jgi:Cu(I)/Ag(I) efflux system protein CusF
VKTLQHILVAGALGAVAAVALPAQAQTDAHHLHATAATVKATATADMTEGEVRKIDKANKKITLKHGAIKNLDMPPMTMVFQASDPSLLDKVKVGDKVRFVAANPGGKLTVTEIQPVK